MKIVSGNEHPMNKMYILSYIYYLGLFIFKLKKKSSISCFFGELPKKKKFYILSISMANK